MIGRIIAATLACAIASGASLTLAACEVECRHEQASAADPQTRQFDSLGADSAQPHACHEEKPADTADTFVRGLQECTHSGPDAPPASIKRDSIVVCSSNVVLLTTVSLPTAATSSSARHHALDATEILGRNPSVLTVLRI
jgi:hypothetical protein